MKHFWILHGAKQINLKYDITRLREKAMRENRHTHLVPGGSGNCSSESPLHCCYPLPFSNADVHLCAC